MPHQPIRLITRLRSQREQKIKSTLPRFRLIQVNIAQPLMFLFYKYSAISIHVLVTRFMLDHNKNYLTNFYATKNNYLTGKTIFFISQKTISKLRLKITFKISIFQVYGQAEKQLGTYFACKCWQFSVENFFFLKFFCLFFSNKQIHINMGATYIHINTTIHEVITIKTKFKYKFGLQKQPTNGSETISDN